MICEYGLPGEEPLGSDKVWSGLVWSGLVWSGASPWQVDLVVYRRRLVQVEAREVQDGQPMTLQVIQIANSLTDIFRQIFGCFVL